MSFAHLHDVASAAGQDGWKAWAYPVSVDLLLVAAWRRLRTGDSKAAGWCWFVIALAASFGANVATAGLLDMGHVPAWLRILVAGWPAVAFLGGALLAHSTSPRHEVTEEGGQEVAEYQKRGAVHFHAVIRIDGPDGGDTSPPAWATPELLTDAIRTAATAARVDGPVIDNRAHAFAFGRQLDVRTIRSADFDGGQELTERAVAAYIAKYATKGAETATGALDRPLKFLAELAQLDISDHARRLIRTAWALGARKELEELRLRAWAHMLGFRGHFSTKSRRYSTTLGALRTARAEWRRAQAAADPTGPDETLVLAHWVYAGTGLTDAEAWLAETIEPALGTEGEPTHG
ncbi:replication initiator [Streptomyces alfalfae]